MQVKDAFEVLVEVLNGQTLQFVEDASQLLTRVGVRIAPIPRSHQDTCMLGTQMTNFDTMLVAVTQHKAHRFGQGAQWRLPQKLQWLVPHHECHGGRLTNFPSSNRLASALRWLPA